MERKRKKRWDGERNKEGKSEINGGSNKEGRKLEMEGKKGR